MKFAWTVIPVALALAGCGGGGSTSTPPAAGARTASATLTFVVPRVSPATTSSSRRSPQYLPATTASIAITLVAVNGSGPSPAPAPTIVNVGASTCAVTSAEYTCTVPLGLPIGSDTLLAQAYDAVNAGGNLLSAQQNTFAIAAGNTNNLSMTLDATPGTIVVTPPSGTTCSGSPLACIVSGTSPVGFTLTVADAHGTPLASNAIAGSPIVSVSSSNTAVATVVASQAPYGLTLTPLTGGTVEVAVTASPATGTSGLSATTLTFSVTIVPVLNQVVTLAGSTTPGNMDGTGSAARFTYPASVAVDAAGNVYVADSFNDEIRKIAPGGVTTTLAGSATSGSADGAGAAAAFDLPYGVAVDAAGNVYVADMDNNEIRKVTSAGVVTTLAGSTTAGSADGTGAAASFRSPVGVAVDAAGNVYVADSQNDEIRKVTPAGVVTTLAGNTTPGSADGTGSAASFDAPGGVAVDASGNVYVADEANNEIRKITPAGVVTTLAGSTSAGSANGTGSAASFNKPQGVAVDAAGNVYVADRNNNEIREVTPAGVVTTLAGALTAGSTNGTLAAARFRIPFGVAVDSAGNVYVADRNNFEIRELTP